MDDLSRALLRYAGRNTALAGLRDRVRDGHEMTPMERWMVASALVGPTPPRSAGFDRPRRAVMERDDVKIGSDALLEADNYEAELIDYTDTKQDGTPLLSNPYQGVGEPKPQWRLAFELTDPDFAGQQLSAWVNKPVDEGNIHPKAKLVEVVNALLPTLAPGQDWTMADLLHHRCRLQVEAYQKTDGTKANKITGFLKLKGAGGETPRQPVGAGARGPVPTVAQRRAGTAAAEPELEELPPF